MSNKQNDIILEDLMEAMQEPNFDPRLNRFRAAMELFELVTKPEKRPNFYEELKRNAGK